MDVSIFERGRVFYVTGWKIDKLQMGVVGGMLVSKEV
jgi:hypothetical protein